jgi:hypothetical protein
MPSKSKKKKQATFTAVPSTVDGGVEHMLSAGGIVQWRLEGDTKWKPLIRLKEGQDLLTRVHEVAQSFAGTPQPNVEVMLSIMCAVLCPCDSVVCWYTGVMCRAVAVRGAGGVVWQCTWCGSVVWWCGGERW